MTITTIYKVTDDNNLYDSEQEAMVAEAIQKLPISYLSPSERQEVAKVIAQKFLLVPIMPTISTKISEAEMAAFDEELDIDGSPL